MRIGVIVSEAKQSRRRRQGLCHLSAIAGSDLLRARTAGLLTWVICRQDASFEGVIGQMYHCLLDEALRCRRAIAMVSRRPLQPRRACRSFLTFDPKGPSCFDDLVSLRQTKLTFGCVLSTRAKIPLSAGAAREASPFFAAASLFEAMRSKGSSTRIGPQPARTAADCFFFSSCAPQAASLRIAPSTTTPALTYFHNATKSLRARATMAVLRAPLRVARALNQSDSADCGW
jgi:hypothetical protein